MGITIYYTFTEGKESPYIITSNHIQTKVKDVFTGEIKNDITWNDDKFILGGVWIDGGVELQIEPGISIYFLPTYNKPHGSFNPAILLISGVLSAFGTEANPVTFTSSKSLPEPGDWGFMKFTNQDDVSTLAYCIVEYGSGLFINGSNPVIEYSSIRNHLSSGILIQNASPVIKKSVISENSISGIFVVSSGSPLIYGNEIYKNSYGIDAEGMIGIIDNPDIDSNYIHDNTEDGIRTYLMNATVTRNRIESNGGNGLTYIDCEVEVEGDTITGNQGIGINCRSSVIPMPSSGRSIIGNEITGNLGGGISCRGDIEELIRQNRITGNWNFGVKISDGAIVDLGDLGESSPGHNWLFDNRYGGVTPGWDVINHTSNAIMAQGNFWGTSDPDTIDSHIYDDDECPICGMVDFGGHYISGEIPGDELWEGFIYICGDILVPEHVTLTIVEGATVCFVANYDINNLGIDEEKSELIVEGNVETKPITGLSRINLIGLSRFSGLFGSSGSKEMTDGPSVHMPIIFTSDAVEPQPGDWYGIEMGGLDNTGLRVRELESSGVKRVIESGDAEQGLLLQKTSATTGVVALQKNIGGNFLESEYGIASEINKMGLLAMTDHRRLKPAATNQNGMELGMTKKERNIHYFNIEYAKRGLALCEGENVSMKDCVFRDNETGLKLRGYSHISVKDCIFKGNTNSGILIGEGISGTIKDDSLYDNGVGVHIQGTQAKACGYQIGNNLVAAPFKVRNSSLDLKDLYVSRNNTGILCGGESTPQLKENKIINSADYGVYITDNAEPNLGGSGHNCIYGSGTYDLYNNTPNRIMAKKNYWGTMNIDSIEAHIYDYYDDNSLGVVEIEPLWNGNKAAEGVMTSGSRTTSFIYSLKSVTPNPFINNTMITYSIARPGKVLINIYDITGRLIKTLVKEKKETGFYTAKWNGCDNNNRKVATGVYFTRLESSNFTSVKKIILVR